jgi:hypothetical protein
MKLSWIHTPETVDEFEGWDAVFPGERGKHVVIIRDDVAYKLISRGYEIGTFESLERAQAVASIGMSEQDLKDRQSIIAAMRYASLAAVWNAVGALCNANTKENMDALREAFSTASAL